MRSISLKVLILDNYDSFTYNLVHLLQEIGISELDVVLNDKLELERVDIYDKIILSPGSGLPKDAGIMSELLNRWAETKSILGVCLGHQGIVERFGGQLSNMDTVIHGKSSTIKILDSRESLFLNLPSLFEVGRYHSWVADRDTLPDCLRVTAEDKKGHIMAIKHEHFDIKGVQFHPESILTQYGVEMLKNWLYL